ncbi:unnamed protein product [Rotaria sordida]|uniref:Uncharacterized protein n=1 Tax=Rotaria sordida TaxID=392033 RepID=A0A814BQ84_9BILA|nr:unnamed protein product [Rotaria sordida]CAF0955036.1 unnamed protein product [Rotaria sordida]
MTPTDSCVPSTISLRCQPNYVVIVRSASYGVAQVSGSCSYTPGDCIADAMSIVTCTTDTVQCAMYATKRKLPQCNDQFSSYVHIEYDCVPISMDDSTKEYNVCQNGTEITSDYGIIRSPGYPTQFQTTTAECFRAIHIPSDKTIRLWLTDLSIGSTLANCAKDHVYVVDSVQTYQHCGRLRYAYPYLCSSTIIIQYYVTSQLSIYRGMRMYFEIVDRPANDNCPNPNGTVTPIPSTTPTITTIDSSQTTPTPPYVIFGIASPVRSFQLCRGQSLNIECPNNYGIVITTNIFGVTQSDQCEPHDAVKHCVVATAPTYSCRRTCMYFYPGNQAVPSCGNKTAAYQFVEYQCIPTNTEIVSPNTPCPLDGSKIPVQINRRGRFQTYNYPVFSRMNCTYRIKTNIGYIMNFYALDISLNDFSTECKSNKVTLIEDGESQGSDFCEQRSYDLIYSSCSNELDLRYIVNDETTLFSSGAQLYIESHVPPFDWACGKPVVTSPQTTIRTTPFITQTAPPLANETNMFARDEMENDICFSSSLTYSCPSGYTFIILGAFYGVKKQSSNKCGFVQGDCTQESLSTITQCQNDLPSCYILYSTKRRLALCADQYADYLHITSQCVPSKSVGTVSSITTYDICDTNNPIGNIHGVVTSPSFPTYKQTTNECRRTIIGIQDRILKIWINEMALSSGGQRLSDEDSNEPDLVIYKNDNRNNLNDLERMHPSLRDTCINDYLIVNTPHVAYVYCGKRKLAIAPICGATIDIQYKTTSPPNLFYKGFKFYFEWIPRPLDITCGNVLPSSTTPINEQLPDWAKNLELSPILSAHICLGTATTIRCPRGSDYVLSIIESNYAVTGTGLCEIPSPGHCHQEASLGLTCTQSCFIEYDIPKPLIQCGSQNADYLNIDYECIPTRLPNNENPIDICGSTTTDTIALNTVMMISPQYPTLPATIRTCSKKVEAPTNKIWMIFIVDLYLEVGQNDNSECDAASLTIYDGKDKIALCGLRQPGLVFISCSNIVEFKFVSTHQALGYRGFKIYSQTIDVPIGWNCVPDGFTTTTPRTTTRPSTTTSVLPPSSQIAAYGGTTGGTRRYCVFPFTYQGNQQSNCLNIDPPNSSSGQGAQEPWCSLTSNFDTDRQWGFCDLGVTDSTLYDICRGQTQILRCPSGYIIDIITADYAAKPNGNIGADACVYNVNDCFQNDASTFQSVCAGKSSCTAYHNSKTLATCQSRPSAYLHIDYKCVPNDVSGITTYDICNNNLLPQNNTRRGFIISPNYPNTQNNIDCTFNLQTLKPNQDIHIYVVNMDLSAPDLLGQSCRKDRLIVSADNNNMEMCGRSYTNFLLNTCHSSVSLQLIRTPDARGTGVKLFFEFRERSPQTICPTLATTTPRPSTVTPPTGTTSALLPIYFPGLSPRMFKTLCYPDFSSLLGSNFQCPLNYVIVIHRAFYGKGSRCDYIVGDCTTEADNVYRTCSGKQKCSVSFLNQVPLPECNNIFANYLFVEYQCLPTPTIVPNTVDLCTGQIEDIAGNSGIFKSPSYPSYIQTQCPNVTLNTYDGSELIIFMYLLDLDIGIPDPNTGDCTNDYLSLSYQCNNQLYTRSLCGTRSTELLFSTCSPTDKIFASYNLLNPNPQFQRGFALLYQLASKFTLPTTISTTTTAPTTLSTTPSGLGPMSTYTQIATTCVQSLLSLRCNQPGYVLVLHKVQLGASKTGSCTFAPNDCFEDRTHLHTTCGGKASCSISAPAMAMKSCNGSRSNYLYAEHQCIPTSPKLIRNICSSTGSTEKVDGGAIISLLNYTSESRQCKIQLQANQLLGGGTHKSFKIYILSLNLPTRPTLRDQGAQCGTFDPSIEIAGVESGVIRLCGNSHTRYLLETCSDTIEIRYNNLIMNIGTTKFKGFEIYLESVQHDICRPTPPPSTPTPPFNITSQVACGLTNGRETVNFACTSDYGLVFLQSYHFVTKQPNQCDVTQYTCSYSGEQPQAQCSGQQSCSYTHPTSLLSPSNACQNSKADSTQFYYQCLPMRPSSQYSTLKLCLNSLTSTNMGFIETPDYPNTYQNGRRQCSLTIRKPNNNDGKIYSIYLYIIELSLRDTSTINPVSAIECFDSIKYSDGDRTNSLCGKIDQPILEYYTDKQELTVILNISESLPFSEWNNWQGARLFYIIGDQSLPSPPTSSGIPTTRITTTTTTTTTPLVNTEKPPEKKPNHGGLIAGIIILIVAVVGIIGFILYRRKSLSRSSNAPTVKYDADMVTVDGGTMNGAAEQRTSIPKASLSGPATKAFVSPFFKKPETTENQETENQETENAPDA